MAEIDYVTTWQRSDPKHAADARSFWTSLKLLQPHTIEERLKELCSLAYSGDELVGLTTVNFLEYPLFRAKFAFYRCAVAPDFRRKYLATFLTRHTLTTMEAWSLENPEADIQGIAAIFEAWELGSKAVYPQWADWNIHLNLAGYTQKGEQVRVA
jgi:hypothetical protein